LFAARMDIGRLVLTSPPAPILEDVASRPGDGGADFDFSASGMFVYQSARVERNTTVQWLDKSGKLEPLVRTPAAYDWLRFSPDGKRLAVVSDQGGNPDVGVYDLERATMSRLTFGGANEHPVWSPDGKHILYASGQEHGAVWLRTDGSGNPGNLRLPGSAASFSPDGKRLAFQTQANPDTQQDIGMLPFDGAGTDDLKPGTPEPFLRTPANERNPMFSRDGRWLAYESDESGSTQIYVRPSPGTLQAAGKWQISTEGGTNPVWSPNGRELFYLSSDRRITVSPYHIKDGAFVAEKPETWCNLQIMPTPNVLFSASSFDIASDGKRFAVLVAASVEPQRPHTQVNMLLNFFDELRRRSSPTK
jgi:eukaryotic-like serine/threonine-protein kinase